MLLLHFFSFFIFFFLVETKKVRVRENMDNSYFEGHQLQEKQWIALSERKKGSEVRMSPIPSNQLTCP